MSGFVIQKEKVGEWLDAVAKQKKVLIPRCNTESDLVSFEPRSAGVVPDWDRLTTTASPKALFFPQSEILMTYEKGDESLSLNETLPGEDPRVIFGARTCDVRALLVMDKVFFDDPYYMKRRNSTTIVAVGCREPGIGCFCESLAPAEGPWDVLMTDMGEAFFVEVFSDKGKELVESGGALFAEASKENEAKKVSLYEEFIARFPERISADKIATRQQLWDDPIFVELSRRCIGCGACTYLCPVCHCFDIQDKAGAQAGVRYRCWDTCQERDFTMMGHGHNPRPSRKERHRQRVLHKFVYIPMNMDSLYGCTGCGRCVEACPVNIDIREVLRHISG